MWYIVWQEPYTSYGYEQGDGYYVGWKNKCEDKFSKNWFEAKKYKSFGSAIDRLRLRTDRHMTTVEDFWKRNVSTKEELRDFKLTNIVGGEVPNIRNLVFSKGRIDKIDEKGNFCGSAVDEVVDWVEKMLKSNVSSIEAQKRKFEKLGIKTEPSVDVSTEEYVDDFLDFFK